MLYALLVVAAVVLFALAGFNVRSPRFAPEWFAFGCLTIVAFHGLLTAF